MAVISLNDVLSLRVLKSIVDLGHRLTSTAGEICVLIHSLAHRSFTFRPLRLNVLILALSFHGRLEFLFLSLRSVGFASVNVFHLAEQSLEVVYVMTRYSLDVLVLLGSYLILLGLNFGLFCLNLR